MTELIQNRRPDRFFSTVEQRRLAKLMGCWRMFRDTGEALPVDEQAELEALVEAELRASAARAAALADALRR